VASLKKELTLAPLVAATYFMVAGGPYGLEELLHKSGYLAAIAIRTCPHCPSMVDLDSLACRGSER
jgi:hypothetical protein